MDWLILEVVTTHCSLSARSWKGTARYMTVTQVASTTCHHVQWLYLAGDGRKTVSRKWNGMAGARSWKLDTVTVVEQERLHFAD